MSKARRIIETLLDNDDEFDPEVVTSAAEPLPNPRVATRKVWSKWRTRNGDATYLTRDSLLLWRKDKWIDERGSAVQKTPRQRNLSLNDVQLTYRMLGRRSAIPHGSHAIYRSPNSYRDVGPNEIEATTYYFYLIDFSPEELREILNNMEFVDKVRMWPDHWDSDLNPLPE